MLGQQFNQPIINLSSGQLIKISEMNSCGPNAVKWNPWSWKRNFDTMEKGVLAKKNILETPGVYPPQIVSQLKLVETSDALVPDLDQNSITNVNKIDTLVTDNLPINVPDVSNEEPCEVSPTILQ
uniref:Uncharacterized protein n=1 Tax=Ciona savignyi TaxID=51511 RepID=H2YSN4_CIOSA